MVRREHWIPVAIAGLTAAFLLASWLVRLSRGHPWLIRRKLRLGALLLGLTWSATGCDHGGTTTCYVPARQDDVSFDDPFYGDSGLRLDLAAGSEMSGWIYGRTSPAYAFQLAEESGAELQRGPLAATDGAFDESTEAFRLALDPSGLPAAAVLRLYRGQADAIATADCIYAATLTIVETP